MTSSDAAQLGGGRVDLWLLDLDRTASDRERLGSLLTTGERSRAGRFAGRLERHRFVACRGLLRLVLSRYAALPPERLVLAPAAGGKPQLRDDPRLRFNLSHAEGRGLLAVSLREVGVDLEAVRALDDLASLSAVCFSPAERAALLALPAPQRPRAFFAGWTRKEAFVKLLGDGFALHPSSFDVSLAPGEPPRLLRFQGDPAAPARYALYDLALAPGFVGALAVEGRDAELVFRGPADLDEQRGFQPPSSGGRSLPLGARPAGQTGAGIFPSGNSTLPASTQPRMPGRQ